MFFLSSLVEIVSWVKR